MPPGIPRTRCIARHIVRQARLWRSHLVESMRPPRNWSKFHATVGFLPPLRYVRHRRSRNELGNEKGRAPSRRGPIPSSPLRATSKAPSPRSSPAEKPRSRRAPLSIKRRRASALGADRAHFRHVVSGPSHARVMEPPMTASVGLQAPPWRPRDETRGTAARSLPNRARATLEERPCVALWHCRRVVGRGRRVRLFGDDERPSADASPTRRTDNAGRREPRRRLHRADGRNSRRTSLGRRDANANSSARTSRRARSRGGAAGGRLAAAEHRYSAVHAIDVRRISTVADRFCATLQVACARASA